VKTLNDVGIKENDDIFTHSNESVFGAPGHDLSIMDYYNALIECFFQAVGSNGTVLMPTYTFSYIENEKYSPSTSTSLSGTLTEIFRKRKTSLRSLHPLYSIAAEGKNAKYYTKVDDTTSFGSKSFFAKLHAQNAKILFFGAPFSSIKYIHYIEHSNQIFYFKTKTISGTTVVNKKEHDNEFTYFSPPSDGSVVYDFFKLEEHLVENNFLKRIPLGKGWVKCAAAQQIANEIGRKLSENPQFLLKTW